MKFLILPDYSAVDSNPCLFLSQNLITLLTRQRHEAAVCMSRKHFYLKGASFYPAPDLPRIVFHSRKVPKTREEELQYAKVSSTAFLQKDLEAIQNAISAYKPDILIEAGRPAALIASAASGIECYSFTDYSVLRNRTVPADAMAGFNAVLQSEHLEQVLSLSELYRKHSIPILSGPKAIQPAPEGMDPFRIGSLRVTGPSTQHTKDVCICMEKPVRSLEKCKSMVRQAWLGAPYHVHAWIKGVEPKETENITFHGTMKPALASCSAICIHDGNSYLFNQCMVNAVPQIIINDGSYRTSFLAMAINRTNAGMVIPASDLSMETLYESYRRIMSDDHYQLCASALAQECTELGGLEAIMPYLFLAKA